MRGANNEPGCGALSIFIFTYARTKRLSGEIGISELDRFLDELPQLRRKNKWHYANSDGSPWIDLVLLHAGSYDNWTFDENAKYSRINLIPVVGSKHLNAKETPEQRHEQYLSLLISIASRFGWKLIEDTENNEEMVHTG